MKNKLLLLTLILNLTCFAQDFDWAIGMGSTNNDVGQSITTDNAGNSYTTGYFIGTVDFDPSANTLNLTSPASGMPSAFIAKYDINGALVWAKNLSGNQWVYGENIDIDASGNLYVTGYFGGTADFDPSASTVNLGVAGESDIFFAKYDNDGNYLWANRIGGSEDDRGKDIHHDGNGNIFITGGVTGTVDFDPSSGVSNVSHSLSKDIYLAKYDDDGNFLWANAFGSPSTSFEDGLAVETDAAGNPYLSAYYFGTVDFDPSANTANLGQVNGDEAVIAKYDVNGNYLWANMIGKGMQERGNEIKVDASGNVYIVGNFGGTVDFDPSANNVNLTSEGNNDIFIAKYDNNGNYSWAKRLGGEDADFGRGIDVDANGNVYIVGSFQETALFDDVTQYALTVSGFADYFVAKYTNNGDFIWVNKIGDTGFEEGMDLVVDDNENIYVTGQFWSTVDFDPSLGETELTSNGSSDIFIQRFNFAPCATYYTSDIENSCGDFTWIDGNTYSSSTTVDYTIQSVSGCDSIVTLDLTVNSPVNVTDEQQSCGSFTWIDGNTYNSSNNTATWVETAANGCDSIILLDLTVFDAFPTGTVATLANSTVCAGDSTTITISNSSVGMDYYLRDDFNNAIIAGPFSGTGSNLDLNTGAMQSGKVFNVFAEGEAETFGVDLPQSTDDYISFSNVYESYGVEITIESWVYSDGNEMPRAGQSVEGVDNNYSSNVWLWTADKFYVNNWGAWLNVTMPSLPAGWTHVATVADANGLYVYYDGVLVNSSNSGPSFGIFQPTNSIITLGMDPRYPPIDVNRNSNTSFSDFRVWDVARSVSEISSNMNECLSGSETGLIQYTKLSEGSGTTVSSIVGEDGFINNGTWTTRDAGCGYLMCSDEYSDEFAVTVAFPTFNTVVESGCNEFTWSQNMETYTVGGTYKDTIMNAAGCDSIVTLELTINAANDETDVISECDSYTWIDGNTYTSSNNTATFTQTNAAGCEYEVTLDLTINSSTAGTDVISACNSYSWIDGNTYTTDNNSATYTLTNAVGCDSVVTLDLTINIGQINTDVSVNGSTLSTDGSGDAYQWIDCEDNNAIINGETSPTFTASSPGEYAVIVTDGDCTETSECVVVTTVGVDQEAMDNQFSLYPNPTANYLQTNSDKELAYKIIDITGKVVAFGVLDPSDFINISQFERGVYFIELEANGKTVKKKFIKK